MTRSENLDAVEDMLDQLLTFTNAPPNDPKGNHADMLWKMGLTREVLVDLINELRGCLLHARQHSSWEDYCRFHYAVTTALRVGELSRAWYGGAHSLFEADRRRGVKVVGAAAEGGRLRSRNYGPGSEVLGDAVWVKHLRNRAISWTQACNEVGEIYGLDGRTVRRRTRHLQERWHSE